MCDYENIPGGFKLINKPGFFKPGTDTVLLSGYPKLKQGMKICELGCGSGALAIMLAARCEKTQIDGVEISGDAVSLAAENIRLNGLEKNVRIFKGDLREIKSILPAGKYDLTISNPPYFEAARGKTAKTDAIRLARCDIGCTIGEVCAAAAYLTRWGGNFAAVFRPERICDLLCAMREHGLEPKRLRFIKNTENSTPSLVLAEGKRGGNKGLKIERDLILSEGKPLSGEVL